MKIKIIYIVFSDYFRHLCYYNDNKYHKYSVFRIILYTYGIIMRIKYNIYCVFRIVLDIYELILLNKNHIYCVFSIILNIKEIIMTINIINIMFFGLF